MSTPDSTVYDVAMDVAHSYRWTLITATCVKTGVIEIDSRRGIVAVHPNAATVTLRMNTAGSLLPGAYAKP